MRLAGFATLAIASLLLAVLAGPATAPHAAQSGASAPSPRAADSQGRPAPVTVAQATDIPQCGLAVDAAAAEAGDGSPARPFKTIAAALEAAAPGAVICVAEGVYAEELRPGAKPITLAGGFQRGSGFKVRDSARFVSRAQGQGGSFVRIDDPAPTGEALTAIDGFEITGYSQAIVRDYWEAQRFEVTNNFIHDNTCADLSLAGAGFALVNVSGVIRGNVFRANSCGRGGAGFLNDALDTNSVVIESNLLEGNAGAEPDSAHGGALYLFGHALTITGNLFVGNTVTQWGAGLYVGAYTEGNQHTTATLSGNVYRANRAGNSGGGFFCDDGAVCHASDEIYDRNCGGNILLDGGAGASDPTTSSFDHITNVGALDPACEAPGVGVLISNYDNVAPDTHAFSNAIFWGNAADGDFAVACHSGCDSLKVRVEHSLVQTRYADGSVAIAFGAGNIAPADPLFMAPESGDLRLQPGSPATTAGADGSALGAFGASGGPAPASGGTAPRPEGGQAPAPQPLPPAAPPAAPPRGRSRPGRAPTPTPAARAPAVARGGTFLGFAERFNRAYTDPGWVPARVIFVSPEGGGDGTSAESPTTAPDALAAATPGTLVRFLPGAYAGGLEFQADRGGTYDAPIVLRAEPGPDGAPAVTMDCAVGTRQTCINLEGASHVAVDGFEMVGGRYGVRSVGLGYAASQHAVGVAILRSRARDQERDPFLSGASDWAVWEGNVASGAGKGDGHGIYLSNGGDWNIVRGNETFGNVSSDFQVNADPATTCEGEGIPVADPRCDAYAGEGEGGQGASDYFLIEDNTFHHGLGPGANFTGLRRSLIRNNIFGPQDRHGVSFWQETDNPRLGSGGNRILHNLFITTGRHAVQFLKHSTHNELTNNLIVGVTIGEGTVAANPKALLMEVDETVGENVYRGNVYVAGRIEGRSPNGLEHLFAELSPAWFAQFPLAATDPADGLRPTAAAPFRGLGVLSADAPVDRTGAPRSGPVDPGPFEVP